MDILQINIHSLKGLFISENKLLLDWTCTLMNKKVEKLFNISFERLFFYFIWKRIFLHSQRKFHSVRYAVIENICFKCPYLYIFLKIFFFPKSIFYLKFTDFLRIFQKYFGLKFEFCFSENFWAPIDGKVIFSTDSSKPLKHY